MMIIVAHHYVVNSGLSSIIYGSPSLGTKDISLLLFCWGGKTGINCFLLITGYFMCTSKITVMKYVKLMTEYYFYSILFFVIFCISGYAPFSLKGFLKMLFPFYTISVNFIGCFLLFYLFIPFLNKLIHALNEKEHLILLILCLCIYTILPSFANVAVGYNYVTWFIVLYFIASYIRLYPKESYIGAKRWGLLMAGSVLLSWISVIMLAWVGFKIGRTQIAYFFVADSNKILAVSTAYEYIRGKIEKVKERFPEHEVIQDVYKNISEEVKSNNH